jgi:hypothetical protein
MRGEERVHRLLLPCLLALAAAACEPPEMELAAALSALRDAEASGAPVYAPTEWTAARGSLDAARSEVELQSPRVRISRDYEDARELLARAKEQASQAHDLAEREKERARTEAHDIMAEARSGFGAVRRLLDELEACRGATELTLLASRADDIALELRTVHAALDEEALYTAVAYGSDVREGIDALAADLAAAGAREDCR